MKTKLTNKDFNKFLESNIMKMSFETKNRTFTLYKIPIDCLQERFQYVYYNSNASLVPFEKIELIVIGIYDTEKKIYIYKENYEYRCDLSEINLEEYFSYTDYSKHIKQVYNKSIFKIVEENHLFFSKENLEEPFLENDKYYKTEIESCLIENNRFNFNIFGSLDFSTDIKSFLKIYINEHKEIQNLAFNYIKKNKEKAVKTAKFIDFQRDHENFLSNDLDFIKRKTIFQCLNNKDIKTFNIQYKNEENEMNVKVENRLNIHSDYISSYWIVSPRQREEFEELFHNKDILIKNIEKITYRKKILYREGEK